MNSVELLKRSAGQLDQLVSLYAWKDVGSGISLKAGNPAAAGDQTVELATGHGIVQNDLLILYESGRLFQGKAVAVSTDTITLDAPLPMALTVAGAAGTEIDTGMNEDGSSTAVTFKIDPPSSMVIDIYELVVVITDDAAMDDAKFGGITAITNGLMIRKKRTSDYENLAIYKSNLDMIEDGCIVDYGDATAASLSFHTLPAASTYSLVARKSFIRNGVLVRVNGTAAEELQIIVQDDLTALASLRVKALGRIAP
nr:hypothetical protein 11 [bacterium]